MLKITKIQKASLALLIGGGIISPSSGKCERTIHCPNPRKIQLETISEHQGTATYVNKGEGWDQKVKFPILRAPETGTLDIEYFVPPPSASLAGNTKKLPHEITYSLKCSYSGTNFSGHLEMISEGIPTKPDACELGPDNLSMVCQ